MNLNQQMEYEKMSKPELINYKAKIRFNRPPYHLNFVKAAYKPGGAFCKKEKDGNVTNS